ncbi:MAG: RecX family transcriptional regulator [Proteiniphilum sp.]|nr:RecX family transcriptional regulator [Proteiniphilum sp.]
MEMEIEMEMNRKGGMSEEEKAYARMTRLCSQKECAPFDIAGKLQGMGLPEPERDRIVDRLRREKYIDEERFVRSYIRDKLRFDKWGRRKIAFYLKQKQLPQELIEEAFSELPTDSFEESLQSILDRKWKTVKGRSDREKRDKLIRYALSRGYSPDEVTACMKKMQTEEDLQ